uniref:T4 RNA ligase 1-like N-terminal domain-containing protein n=1 Tax=Arcella intermedia TaxID=1963864 RepID=A0A6B2L699_9EUKA
MAECREAITNSPGFRELKKSDYVVFSYDFAFRESFPDPTLQADPHRRRLELVKRECRGIIFHLPTQKLLARRFHKFFNINEMDETHPSKIDISRDHVLLSKIDGSLISPFYSEGKLRFGSKLGVTSISEELEKSYFPSSTVKYHEFSEMWLRKNYSPLFEWVSPKHPIILEYEKPELILIAVRNHYDGSYLKFKEFSDVAKEWGVPVVTPYRGLEYGRDYKTTEELLLKVKEMPEIEGFVLMFEDGSMYKLKSNWYVERSKRSQTMSFFEKDLWLLVLNNGVDDVSEILGEYRRKQIEEFGVKLWGCIDTKALKIQAVVDEAKAKQLNKRQFVEYIKNQKEPIFSHSQLFFKAFDGHDPRTEIINFIKLSCTAAPKLDLIRASLCDSLKLVI